MTRKTRPGFSVPGPRPARGARVQIVDPRSDPATAVAFARSLADAGETKRALAALAETTWLHPQSREAWTLRGTLALAVGDVALAEHCSIQCAAALFRAGFGAVADLRHPTARA